MGGHEVKVLLFNTNLLVGKCKESFWKEDIFIPGFVQNLFPSRVWKYLY